MANEPKPVAVLVLGGPYWWAFQEQIALRVMDREDRPLLAKGQVGGRLWLAGMHPAGAQRRGWRANDYAAAVATRISE